MGTCLLQSSAFHPPCSFSLSLFQPFSPVYRLTWFLAILKKHLLDKYPFPYISTYSHHFWSLLVFLKKQQTNYPTVFFRFQTFFQTPIWLGCNVVLIEQKSWPGYSTVIQFMMKFFITLLRRLMLKKTLLYELSPTLSSYRSKEFFHYMTMSN